MSVTVFRDTRYTIVIIHLYCESINKMPTEINLTFIVAIYLMYHILDLKTVHELFFNSQM